MARPTDDEGIRTWREGDALFEVHRLRPTPEPYPRHSHPEYQFVAGYDWPGWYDYRGAGRSGAVGCLGVVHPGEPHAPSFRTAAPRLVTWRVLYLPPAVVAEAAGGGTAPFVPDCFLTDPALTALCWQYHLAAEAGGRRLQRDNLMVGFLTRLVERHAAAAPANREPPEWPGVRRACALIRERLADDLSLDDLAGHAGLPRFRFVRAFRRATGVPPHRYQLHARVDRAQSLLAAGVGSAAAAVAVGFYDQSHLGRHFKRLVRSTPGRYTALDRSADHVLPA